MSEYGIAELSPLARRIGDSPTLAAQRDAAELGKRHGDVISLGAGEPDFATPGHIVAAAMCACLHPQSHKYGAVAGTTFLRDAVVTSLARRTGLAVDPGRVVVANGAKQAVFTALSVLCGPGDDVLLPTPYWPTYVEAIRLAGARPVLVAGRPDAGFRVSPAELEAAWTPRTRCLLINSPSNPTGTVYSAQQARALGTWALERGCWVVSDEIYAALFYDGDGTAPSVAASLPELNECCVLIDGVSKTYAMTGWRVGWLVGPEPVAHAASRLQSHITSNVSVVAQRAAATALTSDQECVERMRETHRARRDIVAAALDAMPGVTCAKPAGTFYAFPSFEAHLGRAIRGERIYTTTDLARGILRHARVVVLPGEMFGRPGHLRLSFATGAVQLSQALDRIAAYLER